MATAKKTNTPAPVEEKKKNLPTAPVKQEVAPAYNYGNMAGAGYEGTDQDDFTMPFLGVLQAMSPEVSGEGEGGALEGARPGMLINSVTKELFSGKEGVLFVPVATNHVYVEWRPRSAGGGIVARHEKDSEMVRAVKASGEFGNLKTDEGNELSETFYMFGYMLDCVTATEPGNVIVVSFTSTKIKVYRAIMQQLRTYKERPPLFANILRITTVSQKNNKGSFFNFAIAPAVNGKVGESLIPPQTVDKQPHPLLQFGMLLNQQVASGARKMADESVSSSGPDGGTGGDGESPF